MIALRHNGHLYVDSAVLATVEGLRQDRGGYRASGVAFVRDPRRIPRQEGQLYRVEGQVPPLPVEIEELPTFPCGETCACLACGGA